MNTTSSLTGSASDRMRWWALMNGWRTPADLPMPVEADFTPCHDHKTRFPQWASAIEAIKDSLSQQQMSWGCWWREEKIGDFGEWQAWWLHHHQSMPSIRENGEPA